MGYQLEQVAQKLFPDFASSCFNLLRHKAIMIGPKLLEANGVRVQKVVHEAGSMIIVFPHAYHSGFNHGFKGVDEAELLEQKAKVTCKAKKQHRFNACKKCAGCRTENCGECEYCLDMPRFGGMGVIKQKCQLRICVNPILRTCDQCVWNV